MKKVLKVSALAAVILLAAGCKDNTPETSAAAELNTDEQKAAYAIGASVGSFASQTLKQQDELGVKLDPELVKKGLLDALNDSVQLTDEEMGTVLRAHEERMNKVVQEKSKAKLDDTRKAGESFLAGNAKKEGVTVTESGLQYEVIKAGTGAKPDATDTVTVHYTGKLIDGKVFDSSKERGQPATFPLNNVIKGWSEGVALMPAGSEYRLYIPSELGCGDQEVGNIPAASVLVFDVELLEIKDKEKKAEDAKK